MAIKGKNRMAPGQDVRQEVATVQRDIDLFAGWLTRLENPDRVLREESAGRGVRLYEELTRDWQVYSMLQTRALALAACEWQVDAASDRRADRRVADFVREVLAAANLDRLTVDLMEAIVTGFKAAEVMWEIADGEVRISEFRARRASRFCFDVEGRPRLLIPEAVFDGIPVPERKFVIWTFGGYEWNPYGRGLGHQLYWPVWFKKNGIRFWMVFAEKFGSPTVMAKYPPGTSAADQAQLLEAIRTIQQQTGIRIPSTMDVSMLEAARTSSIDTYETLCEYMDRAIAKIILGQTLTSEPGDSGSYALGKVHDGVRLDILKADADSLCECLNMTVVRWLVDFNFDSGQLAGYPRLWRRTEPAADLSALAARDKILLVDCGLKSRVPERYVEETYSLPLAKPGEATIGDAAPGAAAAPGAPGKTGAGGKVGNVPAEFAEGEIPPIPPLSKGGAEGDASAVVESAARSQAELDAMMATAARAASAEMEVMLRPLLALVDAAASLEEIGEKLYGLYPDLDSERFQEVLARAIFAAALKGAAAATDEMEADDAS